MGEQRERRSGMAAFGFFDGVDAKNAQGVYGELIKIGCYSRHMQVVLSFVESVPSAGELFLDSEVVVMA